MKQDAKITSIEAAMACLSLHFTQSEGLLAHIERGEEVPDEQMQRVEAAFAYIQSAWKEESLIPKYAAKLFWKVLPRLEACIVCYPHRHKEIVDIFSRISEWFDALFALQKSSEERAMVLVSQHILGVAPLSVELRAGIMHEDSLQEFADAVETLTHVWKQREYIPKLAAYALLNTPEVFLAVADLFSATERQTLRTIEQHLAEQISECLS